MPTGMDSHNGKTCASQHTGLFARNNVHFSIAPTYLPICLPTFGFHPTNINISTVFVFCFLFFRPGLPPHLKYLTTAKKHPVQILRHAVRRKNEGVFPHKLSLHESGIPDFVVQFSIAFVCLPRSFYSTKLQTFFLVFSFLTFSGHDFLRVNSTSIHTVFSFAFFWPRLFPPPL